MGPAVGATITVRRCRPGYIAPNGIEWRVSALRSKAFVPGIAAVVALVGAVFSGNAGGQAVAPPVATFNTPGSIAFVVPAGVCQVSVDAIGAQGGADAGGIVAGGLGGEAVATLAVTAGQSLQV